ncbi:MAG: leucyl aminopeptidase [Myxococcales bacterium]|jgi:leucyl aminopeptidase|nr:leucyl aminopeptidase [Myxococcales bacterium]
MNLNLSTLALSELDCDLLVLPVFDAEIGEPSARSKALITVDALLDGALLEAAAQEKFNARAESSFVLHTLGKLKARRVLLLGLGDSAHFDPEVLRMAAGKAAKIAAKSNASSIALALADLPIDVSLRAAAEGLLLGHYAFKNYKTGKAAQAPSLASAALLLPDGMSVTDELEAVLQQAILVADSVNFARQLVNTPAQDMTPTILAERAQDMAKATGLAIEVLDKPEIEKLGMGMFLAVAKGSSQAPKLIHVTWTPEGEAAKAPALALVGKGITFDAGGLSLKPSEGMVWMKTDMAGGAAVLGAMRAVAHIKPPFPVHAWIGACENMPGCSAYKLGDVLTSHAGKTVEIHNTDAEGRLVLGDVLSLAAEQKPALLVDLATLTGAIGTALGLYNTGLFASDDEAAQAVLDAAGEAGESTWRMPLDVRLRGEIDSPVADLKNSGERYGGSITAALFLKEFVEKTPWVHLDIAGTARSKSERGYLDVGASGAGVRTLIELVRQRAAKQGE